MPDKNLPPEVLYVIGSLDRGGTETHLSLIAPALLCRGWRVTIMCLARKGELASTISESGVAVVGPPREISSKLPLIVRIVYLAFAVARLSNYLWRNKPAITHFFLPAAYCLGGPIALLTSRRPVLMSRRSRNHYLSRRPFFRWWERQLHQKMALIFGNSERVIKDLIEEGAPLSRLRLIHNGIDLKRCIDARTKRDAVRDTLKVHNTLVIITVANLLPYKGHKDLLEALARCKKLPEKWCLLLVGRDGGIQRELESIVESCGLNGRVEFLGSRSDVLNLLGAADLFVLPSHEEGFSNAVLEAMAAGLPVIATDVGGNPEAVVDGHTGFLVPSEQPDAMAPAIDMLASSPELRGEFGLAGYERVQGLFDLARCVEKYDTIYRML